MLHEVKREISLTSKKNFTLEKDIKSLDGKIALLIRNRISLEEVLAGLSPFFFAFYFFSIAMYINIFFVKISTR